MTPWTAACQASLSITNFWRWLKLMSIESVMPSNHLILCRPLLLLPSVFPSIRVFPNESILCIRWPKYWSFSFSISPSNGYLGLISFRTDWFDLLAVQGALKSSPTPQFKSISGSLVSYKFSKFLSDWCFPVTKVVSSLFLASLDGGTTNTTTSEAQGHLLSDSIPFPPP